MPSCLTVSRDTSATVTFSMTCWLPETLMMLRDVVGAAGELLGDRLGDRLVLGGQDRAGQDDVCPAFCWRLSTRMFEPGMTRVQALPRGARPSRLGLRTP